ncbi:MAG: hypothetical protein HY831_03390 [Candidatus Aenigmarchaeota archaeon]|nr:hypothetical protein [Candidatus Aenigmarchaeota archaeon]
MDLSERRKANQKIAEEAISKDRRTRNLKIFAAIVIFVIVIILVYFFIISPWYNLGIVMQTK